MNEVLLLLKTSKYTSFLVLTTYRSLKVKKIGRRLYGRKCVHCERRVCSCEQKSEEDAVWRAAMAATKSVEDVCISDRMKQDLTVERIADNLQAETQCFNQLSPKIMITMIGEL